MAELLGLEAEGRVTRTVVLSPHLDDAVIDLTHVLRQQPVVVNLFTGRPPEGTSTAWDRICGWEDSRALMEERQAEDRAALSLFGVEPINAGLLDNQYRNEAPVNPVMIADWLVRQLGTPEMVYVPIGVSPRPHPDHVITRNVGAALAAKGVAVRLYADAPHCVKSGAWPGWVDTEAAYFLATSGGVPEAPYWEKATAGLGIDLRHPTVARLTPAQIEDKMMALRTYATQYRALNNGFRSPTARGLLKRPDVVGFEPVWEWEGR